MKSLKETLNDILIPQSITPVITYFLVCKTCDGSINKLYSGSKEDCQNQLDMLKCKDFDELIGNEEYKCGFTPFNQEVNRPQFTTLDDCKTGCCYKNIYNEDINCTFEILKEAVLTEAFDNKDVFIQPDEEDLEENIETHDTLNPKLFTDNKLNADVREAILAIVKKYVELLEFNNIKIDIRDIILTGSNANYNYTDISDIDVHILANTDEKDKEIESLYNALYDAYRSLFSKKFTITIHDIPVEIYVETESTPLASHGVYSVQDDKWLKEPVYEDIPEVDKEALDKEYSQWEAKCEELIHAPFGKHVTELDVNNLIADIYEVRKKSLAEDGEYGLGNLVFKELRNNGYMDLLKQLRDDLASTELSLESLKEATRRDFLTDRELLEYKIELSRIAYNSPVIDIRGNFSIYNVKQDDCNRIISRLRQEDWIDYVSASPSGKYDFSTFNGNHPGLPNRYFTIQGRIKM